MIAMYFPPKTQEEAKAEPVPNTTHDLIDSASGVISEALQRTLPIIGLDISDGLGLCQGQRHRCPQGHTKTID